MISTLIQCKDCYDIHTIGQKKNSRGMTIGLITDCPKCGSKKYDFVPSLQGMSRRKLPDEEAFDKVLIRLEPMNTPLEHLIDHLNRHNERVMTTIASGSEEKHKRHVALVDSKKKWKGIRELMNSTDDHRCPMCVYQINTRKAGDSQCSDCPLSDIGYLCCKAWAEILCAGDAMIERIDREIQKCH